MKRAGVEERGKCSEVTTKLVAQDYKPICIS